MTAIRPEKILKDLAKLWVDLAREKSDKNSAGVLRACAMTLVVAVEQQDEAQSVGETIAELMHEHPSRAIVLKVQGNGGGELAARVFAQCWMPFGRRQQICCEEIEITAPETLLADVPKLLLGLTVPDLPVVLWVRCPRMAMHGEFQKVFPLANKIIVDSDCFGDPQAAYDFVAGMNRRGKNVADLAWTRLTRWRQMVAQIFEDEQNRQYAQTITTATIIHGGDTIGVGARYLASWLKHALPRAWVNLNVASGAPSIVAIEFRGENFSARVAAEDRSSAVLTVNGMTSRIALPPSTEQALLREELGIVGIDPVFRRCFE